VLCNSVVKTSHSIQFLGPIGTNDQMSVTLSSNLLIIVVLIEIFISNSPHPPRLDRNSVDLRSTCRQWCISSRPFYINSVLCIYLSCSYNGFELFQVLRVSSFVWQAGSHSFWTSQIYKGQEALGLAVMHVCILWFGGVI